MAEWIEILVAVKTSPLPSTAKNVIEHVCTAGVRRDGSWVRVYPVSYRLLPESEKYRKYQWIELEVVKAKGDKRPESYRPTNNGGIKCGAIVGKERYWQERRQYVIPTYVRTMCEYQRFERNECSLGVVKPNKVKDIAITPSTSEWPERFRKELQQRRLFDNPVNPLKNVPYEFRYQFKCAEPNCPGHCMSILDWELSALYWNELRRLGTAEQATQSVKQKYLDDLCGDDKDTYFFVGTHHYHPNWMVTGVFYPKKSPPMLFNT